MTLWDPFENPEATKADHLAAYLLEKLGRLETMKLQKLLYYCNGWSLGLTGKPIFDDKIEAWKHGPVIPSIYKKHRREPSVASWPAGRAFALSGQDKAVADAVIAAYGALSGWAMREMTHGEDPWLNAWERSQYGAIRHTEITQDEIATYFGREARKGQAQNRAKTGA